jgi:predicted RNase H-like nuclease (RuvC/YqgF family)
VLFQLEAKDQETEQQLSSELTAAQAQLASCQRSLADLTASKLSLQAEVNQLKDLLELAGEELSLQEVAAQKEIIIQRDREIEALHRALNHRAAQVDQLKAEMDTEKENFEIETANWLSEKEKVIRYQKQLQLNYVSMYKRNKSLETEMEQLRKALADATAAAAAVKSSSVGGGVSSGGGGTGGHVSSAKAKLFSKFSSKFGDGQ